MPSISKITVDGTQYDIKDPQVQELSDNLDSFVNTITNQYGHADAYADGDGIYKVTLNVPDGYDALAFYIDGTCTGYSFDKTTWYEPVTGKLGLDNLEGKVMYLKGENITGMYYMTASNKNYLGSIKGLANQMLLDNNPSYSSLATIFMNLCGGGVFDEDAPLMVLSDTIAEWANAKFVKKKKKVTKSPVIVGRVVNLRGVGNRYFRNGTQRFSGDGGNSFHINAKIRNFDLSKYSGLRVTLDGHGMSGYTVFHADLYYSYPDFNPAFGMVNNGFGSCPGDLCFSKTGNTIQASDLLTKNAKTKYQNLLLNLFFDDIKISGLIVVEVVSSHDVTEDNKTLLCVELSFTKNINSYSMPTASPYLHIAGDKVVCVKPVGGGQYCRIRKNRRRVQSKKKAGEGSRKEYERRTTFSSRVHETDKARDKNKQVRCAECFEKSRGRWCSQITRVCHFNLHKKV